MTGVLGPADLDSVDACEAGDPDGMLVAVATSAAQVREAALLAREAGLDQPVEGPRPRAVVCTGMGGSGIAGDILAAVAGPGCPVPVVVHKGYGLPGWVGSLDVVLAVSCSGSTEETLSAAQEAHRRGARLLAVAASGSPLAELAVRAGGVSVPVEARGRLPRALVWALAVPLLVAAGPLGLGVVPAGQLEAAAAALEDVAQRCRVASESFVNPAKDLALRLHGVLPMIWGASPLMGVAAARLACQLNENAKLPAVAGVLPEANHNQVVTLDGPTPPHLLLLRDTEEHPQVRRRAEASAELAADRGVALTQVTAEGASPIERLARVVGLLDWASVYLALLAGVDPTPIAAIAELKARIAR